MIKKGLVLGIIILLIGFISVITPECELYTYTIIRH